MDDDRDLRARAAVHAALGDPTRLAIADELAVSDRTAAELRRRLGIDSNLAAHHIAVLESAGLLHRSRSKGDGRRRYLRLSPAARPLVSPPAITAEHVVFVCTRNSARSQLAAALWNRRHDVPATSAGTDPAAVVHPQAVKAARAAGLDLARAVPRRLDDLPGASGLVVTVCDLAHEELEPSAGRALHWSTDDPADDGRAQAFREVLEQLRQRVERLAPLVSGP